VTEPGPASGNGIGARDLAVPSPAPDQFGKRLLRHVRHYARGLNHVGVLIGLLFFVMSLTPSLLPRPWPLQGVVSGITTAGGYGFGVAIWWGARRIGIRPPSAQLRRRAWHGLGVVSLITVPIALWLSSSWQQDIRHAIGAPAGGRNLYLGVFAVAALVATGLVGLVRLFHDIYRMLMARLLRILPRVLARLAASVLVAVLAVGLASGVLYRGLLRAANTTYAAADHGDKPGVTRPASPERSGSPASLVAWDSLGTFGRYFLSGGPSPGQITELTGRPAIEPIRVFAGLASAPTLQGEANLVLAELKRTGAFDRALLAVAGTTGRGWVDATLADPLEYMYGGDTAIAAMQYSHLPSWMSFLVDLGAARQAARDLFDTVYGYWSTLPAAHRPRLVVFGESLGAYGADAVFSSVADITLRTNGALFAGPPNRTQLWRELTDKRATGSLERLPRYGNGQTVRFAASAGDLRQPDGSLSHPTIVYLQHASDPIVWWSTKLIWQEPDWLTESRGPDVVPRIHWYPFVTFWQITCDMVVGLKAPPGHGHHYGPEIPTAWAAILHPPNWTDANTAALTAK
jgi:uncharacterized membrane protein